MKKMLMDRSMLKKKDEIISSYIDNSLEQLVKIESYLVVVYRCQKVIDGELVNKILVYVRYIRDGASVMGLKEAEKLAHAIENSLELIRDGKLSPSSGTLSVLILVNNELKEVMANINTINRSSIDACLGLLHHLNNE